MSDMLNRAITNGPSRCPTPSPCSTPPTSATSSCCGPGPSSSPTLAAESTTVRFRSLDGRDREIAVPRLTFTEPITTLAGAARDHRADIDFSSLPQVDQQTARPPKQVIKIGILGRLALRSPPDVVSARCANGDQCSHAPAGHAIGSRPVRVSVIAAPEPT